MKDLEKRIEAIEARNKKVELDKAWETSIFRRVLIALLTYFVVVTLMGSLGIDKPLINAIIPAAGFVLSTLTISYLKNWWINKQ